MKRLENKVAIITAAGQGTNKSFLLCKIVIKQVFINFIIAIFQN